MSLVYEDEILPEIEIRELLSLEQVLEENPSFIAFTKNEITDHILDLLKNQRKADLFTDAIFDSVQATSTRGKMSNNVVPVVRAGLNNFEDDEREYAAKLSDIANAPNYTTQQQMLSGLAYPLQHVPPTAGDVGIRATDRPITVGIDGGIANISKLIPSDGIEEACTKAAYVVPDITSESYLNERVENTGVPRVYSQQTHNVNDATPLSAIRPAFNSVIDLIKEVTDIHGLKHHLERYDYSFDALTPDQLSRLVIRLKDLTDPIESRSRHTRSSESSRPAPMTHNAWSDFYDALKKLGMPSIAKEKYSAIYDALMASIPPQMINVDVPLETGKILDGLYSNSFTLEDVATFMKMTRNKIIVDNAFATLQRYLEKDPESLPESIQNSIDKWVIRSTKYDDRTAKVFLELYRDMTEIKKGNDTSAYDGNPFEQPDQVFEEMQYEYVETPSDEEFETDTNAQTVIEDDDIDMTILDGITEGVREIIIPVLRKIAKLQKLSGIHIVMKDLVAYIAPRIVRISFQQILAQHVPELASDVRLQLASGNYESAARIAANIVPVSIGHRAQEAVREMYKEYHALMKATFLQCFSWYVLTTQEAAIEKRLDFDPMSGMLACIRSWSPFGPPITKDKDPEGVIYYLACVAQESVLLEEYKWTSDDLVKNSLAFMSDNMSDIVDRLHEKWDAFSKENTLTVSKARQANLSLAEAIQMKLKKRILPDYVRAFLYIPGMLNTTKHPSHTLGCCMQKLGPEFRADSDWQDLKKLRAVKDQFAKKRMTKTDPPNLAWLEKPVTEVVVKPPPVELYIPTTATVEQDHHSRTLGEWLDKCVKENLYLLPADAVQAIKTDPMSLNSTISKNVSAFLKTCNKKSALIESYFGKNQVDMRKMLDIVATNLRKFFDVFDQASNEYIYITSSLTFIKHFKTLLEELPLTADPVDATNIQYILRFATSRALCLPADPRDAGRIGKLTLSDRVGATFTTNILVQLYSKVNNAITASHMPSIEDQQAFITKMREIQKVQTLEIYNKQSDEDRQIMIDAKKVGLFKVDVNYEEDIGTTEIIEEEPEYVYRGEDPEQDIDTF